MIKNLLKLSIFFSFYFCNAGYVDDIFKSKLSQQHDLKKKINTILYNKEEMRLWHDDLTQNYPEFTAKIKPEELANFFQFIFSIKCEKDIDCKYKYESEDFLDKALVEHEKKGSDARIKAPLLLGMCVPCAEASYSQRMLLIFLILNDVAKKYQDINSELVYTSFASCTLLQDFMIIAGLIALGYRSFKINFIDIFYAKKNDDKHDKIFHTMQSEFLYNITNYASYAKKEFKQLDIKYFDIKYYGSSYEYITDVKSGSAKKSNILIAVDWGKEPTYRLSEPFDLNKVDFVYINPFKTAISKTEADKILILSIFSHFFLEISLIGSLSLLVSPSYSSTNLDDLIQFLITIREGVLDKMRKDGIESNKFRQYFIEELKKNHERTNEIAKNVCKHKEFSCIDKKLAEDSKNDWVAYKFFGNKLEFCASIPLEWKRLIDETGIDEKDKLVIYQLTGDTITDHFRNDTEEDFAKKILKEFQLV